MAPIPFEPGAIRMLAKLMNETGLTEIELAEKDRRIRVVRGSAQAPMQQVIVPNAVPHAAVAAPATIPAVDPGAVLSPMVGVAYLTPEPNAPTFIDVGARVDAGQTLLLIEAMKTFNPITAPKAGTVTKILIESGDSVDQGQPLVVIG
ncbi:acetyl-CoA carboxylase biotin carboxyl carrier protein subunit [Bradyrhizobium sp. LHD-71]|uniref:acetyl-CoA carboxylase biotin carboxyl carrier protein n=1 Tax=Bradyrhizobium sp. LHD-71 TaxID=3072141 RepID=UPI00280EE5B1|nr:acetyl-CoA carboxylase biotin carboxyl carrier protein subunit [Bradyrhizobium sp. LHD-71]MDQ8732485.1 acetyl-CoA carboxylase biotin carboxyl carrier protein subunit [Bradyrhizobium sp. LHD-71]